MGVGGKKDDYDFHKEQDDLEWWAEIRMNIREVRMLWSSLDHYQNIWPGPESALGEKLPNVPRPREEKDFLEWYKGRLFAMITDYNYTHHDVDASSNDSTPSGNDT